MYDTLTTDCSKPERGKIQGKLVYQLSMGTQNLCDCYTKCWNTDKRSEIKAVMWDRRLMDGSFPCICLGAVKVYNKSGKMKHKDNDRFLKNMSFVRMNAEETPEETQKKHRSGEEAKTGEDDDYESYV
jgi:hypothetical protein